MVNKYFFLSYFYQKPVVKIAIVGTLLHVFDDDSQHFFSAVYL